MVVLAGFKLFWYVALGGALLTVWLVDVHRCIKAVKGDDG